MSPGSLQEYRSLNTDYQKVAEDFGVQYVVEGSLRRAGDKLRINASLVDATTGAREWSERYDQPLADLFEILDDITQQIVSSLGSQVRRAEGRKSEKADPDQFELALEDIETGIAQIEADGEANPLVTPLYLKPADKPR